MIGSLSAIARRLLPAAAIQWLRGEHNSVRQRFWYNPKERFALALHRLRGGRYLDWYAKRLDGFVDFTTLDGGDGEALRRFDSYMSTGGSDLDVAKAFGLRSDHKLHEFGVGFLRTAQHFIGYLEVGNFSGNDASQARIAFGADYLRRKTDIDAKRPLLVVNADNSFDWLDGRKVDFVWSEAVFTHMPPQDIDETLKNVRKIMKPDTIFLFTYSEKKPGEVIERMNVKDWWHNFEFFQKIAERYGFDIEDVTHVLPKNGEYNVATRLAKLAWHGEERAP